MMRRRQRDGKKILRSILLWLLFIVYINIISPSSVISFAGFYFFLSAATFFTLKTFFSSGRTIIWLGVIVIYLLLRQFHIDNILNTIILIGIFITFEIYFKKS